MKSSISSHVRISIFTCEGIVSFLSICYHSVYHWLLYNNLFCNFLYYLIFFNQEIIKVREWIPHIGPLTKVIRLKLFLDIVPSSSEDITSRDAWTAEATFTNYLRKMAGTSFYIFWLRFIPKMFSALSAALLSTRAFRLFLCSFDCSLFCRLFGFRELN